jgi:putative thymidine phosphorylase
MELKIKNLKIKTGRTLIALMNSSDARELDLHSMDRIKITKKNRTETVILDITQDSKILKKGEIIVFEEVRKLMNLRNNDKVSITMARKPKSLDYIKRKLDGKKLNKEQIEQIIWDIGHNKLNDIEMTYFTAACYANFLDDEETIHLINAMTNEGDILKVNSKKVIDKHCIGGVAGNRTSMLVVPILAAAGLKIPKTSSRSITSPAGTADTMEVLCNVTISLNKMKTIVEKANGCLVWGGALNLAPTDDKIIHIEKPLSIDAKSQLLASIISKKLSVSSTHILIDIPWGEGSKIEKRKDALALKKSFEKLSRKLGVVIKVILTDGRNPIGKGIGPALEARDVLWVLENHPNQPIDLREKGIKLAGHMLEMAGKAKKGEGEKKARAILDSKKAYKKMIEIIKLQGAKITDPDKIKVSKYKKEIVAYKTGKIVGIDNQMTCKVARFAGAPENPGTGVFFIKKVGERVKEGEVIYEIYAGSNSKLKNVEEAIDQRKIYKIK